MRITDVIELFEAEQAFGTPGSKAMGSANFALLSRYYTQPARRTSSSLKLNFGNGRLVELDKDDVEAIAKYYDTLPHDSDRYNFVYDTMSRADKFNAMLYKIGRRQQAPVASPLNDPENQMSLDINEYASKKNSEAGINRDTVRSAELNRALKQAYARYPNAASDMEALIMHDMDVQKSTGQELQAQARTNQRQDDIDAQMRDVARKQSNKISSLDQENDDLTAELNKLSRELDAMSNQADIPKDPAKADTKSRKDRDTDAVPTRGDSERADRRGQDQTQRAADAEKRTAEKPASKGAGPAANFGSLGATVPRVRSAEPLPTIDVIDQPEKSTASPALGQMVRQISRRAPPPSIGRPEVTPAEPAPPTNQGSEIDDPETDPDFDPDSAYNAARNSEEIPDTNVFQFPGKGTGRRAEPEQPDLFGNPRTGTHNESRELRRMRELAGLTE